MIEMLARALVIARVQTSMYTTSANVMFALFGTRVYSLDKDQVTGDPIVV